MSTKSICLVSAQYLPHVGGVENFVYNLSGELVSRGHSVTVVTSGYGDLAFREYDSRGVEIIRLPSRPFMAGRFPVLVPSRELRAFKREFLSKKYDLVLINTRFYFLSLTMAKLSSKAGFDFIIMDHGSSHLNTGSAFTTKLSEYFEHFITAREKRLGGRFAGVSRESLGWLTHFGITTDILFTNAIDAERFDSYLENKPRDFRAELNIPDDKTVVSFVGRLTKEKGIRELVSVMKRIGEERDDAVLLCAGDGYLLPELEAVKHRNTVFLGKLPPDEVAALLSGSDIFCLPSYSEGFPTSVLEASLGSTFVITTAKGDAKEIISDESLGTILPDADEEGLYRAMIYALDNPEHRKLAGERVREIVLSRYTWKNTADSLLSQIEQRQD